jgi:acyl-CoA thioester hydrolase
MKGLLTTYKGMVYPWHCDHMGHMNVMWYVGKFDEATWHLFSAVGLAASFLRENRRGMAAVRQDIAYKRELRAGDAIAIRSGVLEIREKWQVTYIHAICSSYETPKDSESILCVRNKPVFRDQSVER